MKFTDEATGATFNMIARTVELWCIGPGDCGFVEHRFFDYPALRSYCECQRVSARPELIFQNYRALDRVLMAEVRAEDPEFVTGARKEYLKSAITDLRADLAADKAFGLSRVWAQADLALLRSCYRDSAARLKKMERELRGLLRPTVGRARLTEEQMQQAREFPIADLLDGVRAGDKIICPNPNHKEKTASCMVFDDHLHCFSCGFHENAIGYTMLTKQLSFIEAVRELIS